MRVYQRDSWAIVSDHKTFEKLEETGQYIAVEGGLWEVPR